jgi:acyl-CoA dehydrogenase
LNALDALLESCLADYERVAEDPAGSTAVSWLVRLNNLKLVVSTGAYEVVVAAMLVCGMAGYRNDTEYSIGRFLRDSASASLMVHNDRITNHNANLISAVRG